MARPSISKFGTSSSNGTTPIVLNLIQKDHHTFKKNINDLQNVDTEVKTYLDSQDNRIKALERKIITLENTVKSIQKGITDKPKPLINSVSSETINLIPKQ